MARIPEAEIERLKSEVPVERLVEGAGIELRKSGKDRLGRCPFHEDDTASLVVTPEKNLWHCFGCGIGGGPIDWVIKSRGVSFRHAVELLREGLPDSSLAAGPVKQSRVRQLGSPVELAAGDQELLNQVIDFYHQTLLASPEALAYLERRGIASRELIERHRLGFANRTLGLRLPVARVKAGGEIRARLQALGLLRASGHEHFNGCLVVPVFAAERPADVVGVYGRKITAGVNPPLHLYLPGPHRGLWNAAGLAGAEEVILCEALIDAMTFWCAGYRHVTSAYGAEGFTDEMLDAMKRCGTQRVLIAFDRDEAGERGAAKVAERLMAAGIDCLRLQFPKGMDANDYALKVRPADKSLGVAIRQAVWLGRGGAPARRLAAADRDLEPAVPESESLPVAAGRPETPIAPVLAAAAEPSLAAAAPAAEPPAEPAAEAGADELVLCFGDRRYRVRGLAKNLGYHSLKVNVLVSRGEGSQMSYHVDTFDLYAARSRDHYLLAAAQEIGVKEEVVKRDLGQVLLKLEALQDAAIQQALVPKPQPGMIEAEKDAALALLTSPDLVGRILSDFAACGLVGEETNKLVGYLAAISRKLDRPLGVVIQSSSAAGKSSLMDAVLAFVPEEEKVKYSAMTGQSLFYMGETNLKHKALAIVEEEGASKASYALKLLQSEGELTIASTGKDPESGNLVTQAYRVEGPVALLFTTTARDLDEELMNRCLVLAVDEGREQTRAIHARQRERRTLDGLLAKQARAALIALHQNAQRLLRPLDVLNPYAQFLTFPDQTTRLRRDHEKYLTLIDAIALHQHQRPIRSAERNGQRIEYLEATLADIDLANRIAHDVLGRSLDELPPQTRRLLMLIDGHVASEAGRQAIRRCDVRFTRRALREAIQWGDTQLRLHLARLVDLEYVLAHREGPGGQYVYELAYEVADDARAQVAGLTEIAALEALAAAPTTAKSRGADPEVAGASKELAGELQAGSGPLAAGSRGAQSPEEAHGTAVSGDNIDDDAKPHVYRGNGAGGSYPQPAVLPAVLPLAAAGV